MVSKKVLEQMKTFSKHFTPICNKVRGDTQFDLETDVAWFDNYEYNLRENNDGYDNEYVMQIINYGYNGEKQGKKRKALRTMKNNIKKSTLKEIKDMIQFCLKNDGELTVKQLNELNNMINLLVEYANGK